MLSLVLRRQMSQSHRHRFQSAGHDAVVRDGRGLATVGVGRRRINEPRCVLAGVGTTFRGGTYVPHV